MINHGDDKDELRRKLYRACKSELITLIELRVQYSSEWDYYDPIYRFYYQSFKVYHLQSSTERIVQTLRGLLPEQELHKWFSEIVARGTNKSFDFEHNKVWVQETAPIVEAFFHAKFFLEAAIQTATENDDEEDLVSGMLPSHWAALLLLYGLR